MGKTNSPDQHILIKYSALAHSKGAASQIDRICAISDSRFQAFLAACRRKQFWYFIGKAAGIPAAISAACFVLLSCCFVFFLRPNACAYTVGITQFQNFGNVCIMFRLGSRIISFSILIGYKVIVLCFRWF